MRWLPLLLLLASSSANAQSGGGAIGGAIAFGGKPTAALILNPVATAILTNVNSVAVGIDSQGTNRLALAVVHFNGTSAAVTSVSTGSQSFTSVGCAQDENLVKVCIWRLIAPTVGTATVTTTFSEIVGATSLNVLSFENVSQASPTSGFVETGAGSNSVSLSTSSAVGDLVITVFVSSNNAMNASDDTLIVETQPGAIIWSRIGRKVGATTVNWTAGLAGTNAWNGALLNVVKN